MKIALDYGSQWDGMHCWDLFAIGIYRDYHLKSIGVTILGFYFDIDFYTKGATDDE